MNLNSLFSNIATNEKHKEFLEKFYQLIMENLPRWADRLLHFLAGIGVAGLAWILEIW